MASLRDIAALLSSRPLDDKIIIAPSSGAGRQLLERIVLEGHSWMRTRALTPGGLARAVLGESHPVVLGQISEASVRQYIHDICLSMFGKDSPYFPLRHSDGLHRSLHDAYELCVLSDCDPAALPVDAFEHPVRGQLIPLLLGALRTRMRRDTVFTRAEMIAEAVMNKDAQLAGTRLFIEAAYAASLSPLEMLLLERCDSITQLDSPPPLHKLRLRRASTDEFEIRAALRHIVHSDQAADAFEIVLARSELLPLCFELTRLYDLPATFDPGIPLHYSKASRTIVCWLRWLSRGFDAAHLIRMMYDGIPAPQDVMFEDQRGGRLQMASLLRTSAPGWGRSRLLQAVDRRIATMAAQDGSEGAGKQLRIARANREWLQRLLDITPQEDSEQRLSLRAVAHAARSIVLDLCRDAYPGEKLALDSIADLMADLQCGPDLLLPAREIAQRVSAVLRAGTYPMVLQAPGAEALPTTSPLPGHLHFSSLQRGGWSGRAQTLLLGCDADALPGASRQNPVLLDSERRRLGDNNGIFLPLEDERTAQRTAAFHSLLSRQRGSITISWSTQSPVERSARSLSHLVLDAFRAQRNQPALRYEDLHELAGEMAGLLPGEQPLAPAEWWLQQRRNLKETLLHDALCEWNPLHRTGAESREARTGDAFTAWDGHVGPGQWEFSRPLSPSALELLARCPYAFFLQRMLSARDPEPWKRAQDGWLNHLEHGTFMHELLQEFLQPFARAGRRPDTEEDRTRLQALALTRLDTLQEVIPCPSPAAFESERRRVLVECGIALRMQETLPGVPFLLEAGFGMPHGDNTCGEITLATTSGTMRLRGQIDRVDHVGEQRYDVWDYKTGSDFTRRNDPYRQGRSLQHGLYALAAEQMMETLDRAVSEIQAGYLFISEKTQGKAVPVPGDPDTFQAILDDLAALLSSGSFPHSPEKEDCRFCEFQSVCVYPDEVNAQSRDKMDASGNAELDAFRRLRDA